MANYHMEMGANWSDTSSEELRLHFPDLPTIYAQVLAHSSLMSYDFTT